MVDCMIYDKVISLIESVSKPIINLIDKSKLTDQEKLEGQIKIKALENEALKEAVKLNLLDAQSDSKFRSWARPAFLWLFYGFIGFSLPMGVLNYFGNNLYLAILDGMKTYLSIIPEYMIWAFSAIVGVNHIARTIEKKK